MPKCTFINRTMAAEEKGEEFLKEIEELLQETSISSEEPLEEKLVSDKKQNGNIKFEEQNDFHSHTTQSKLESIRDTLSKTDDTEILRELCYDGIPEEIRLEVWRALLGVRRRPDSIGTWKGPLDCDNQLLIHQQCLQQAGRLVNEDNQLELATLMEEVITFYCKSRNISYTEDNGWIELIAPFVAMGTTKADLFNCLYVLLAKYIPRDCRAGGRPFDLFRLLLLYHDPELCSLLDTRKLYPHLYLQPWIRSLFSSQCNIDVVQSLWDLYLVERDPFFVFFLALVMVINAKELVMETSTNISIEELNTSIVLLPQQLTCDDISDLFSLSQYYAVRTPQSFRKDYHNMLFGSTRFIPSVSTGVLCLPIQMQEIIDSVTSTEVTSGMKYFVIDCRPLHQYSVGHIFGSMHLDTDLLLHSPSDFDIAMERLCERVKENGGDTGEHICFMGSGREQEDQYMNMVIAKFLQQSIPYISVARGGYLELWRILGNRTEQLLEDFDVIQFQKLYEDNRFEITSSPARSENSDSESESYLTGYYRQKLQAKSAQLYASLATGWRDKSQRLRVRMGEIWKNRQIAAYKDRPLRVEEKKSGKRYHNLPDNVFVIADDDEDTVDLSSDDDINNPLVNISLYSTSPDIYHSFPCSEITESNHLISSHLLLTTSDMVILREAPDRSGWGRVKHRENLSSILKITAKKHHQDIITFKYGYYDDEVPVVTHQLRLRLPNTRKATQIIRDHILKLTKSTASN